MAESKITDIKLRQNSPELTLLELSPLSLPFDNEPIERSPNLINSGKIYELHLEIYADIKDLEKFRENFIKLQCGVILVNNPNKTDFVLIFNGISGIAAADRIYVEDFKTAIDFINKIKNLGGRTNWTIWLNNGVYGNDKGEGLTISDLTLNILNKNGLCSIDCRLQYRLSIYNSYVTISNIHFGGEENGSCDANVNAYYNSTVLLTNCKFYAGPTINYSILIMYNSTLSIYGNTEFHFPLYTFYNTAKKEDRLWFQAIRIGGGYNAINTINGVTFKGQEDYDYDYNKWVEPNENNPNIVTHIPKYKYAATGIAIFGGGFITLNSNNDSEAEPVSFEHLYAGIMVQMGGYVFSNSILDFRKNVKMPFAQDLVYEMTINEAKLAGGICILEKYILLPLPTT